MKILETDPKVVSYCEQPLKLDFEWNNRTYSYTPDVLSVDIYSHTMLYEVKPTRAIEQDDGRLKVKFKAAQSYCSDRGWDFEVVTDLVRGSKEFHRADFLWPHLMNPSVNLNRAEEIFQSVSEAVCFKIKDLSTHLSWSNSDYCLLLYLVGRGRLIETPYGQFGKETILEAFNAHGK
jgi:hypothetical protein